MIAQLRRPIDAISLDFYGTLIHPCNGRGRGSNLIDYLRAQGLEPNAWDHGFLYDVFARHDTDYSPDLPAAERREYLRRLTARALACLGVAAQDASSDHHEPSVWRILGPEAFCLFPETRDVLDALRARGYPIALVSNWQRGLGHFCAELELADAFEHVIASAEVGVAKPDRRIFDEACTRLGVPPDRVLHVGDTLADDYEGARAAGLQAILLQRGSKTTPEDVSDVETISDLRRLLPLLAAP